MSRRVARDARAGVRAVGSLVNAVRNVGPTSRQIADTAAGHVDAIRERGVDDASPLGATRWPPDRAC